MELSSTYARPQGVVRGRAAVGQRVSALTSLPDVGRRVDRLVGPAAHRCILKVTPEPPAIVALWRWKERMFHC